MKILFTTLAVLSLLSCKDATTQPDTIAGNYNYIAYDSTGAPVLRDASVVGSTLGFLR